ncbi:hypothetical protein NP233_g9430 [Leucocoprinus birnbaumii]|uniref:Uncharacterized protein n=1 Tax=Leucocoprinus birnbaumii TaxID=56174 RepID=A0AAD5YN73_9AGAR|nr:hypothetical protein NP233_g9430 [Leucocoprinus birnbaumii]
MKLFAVSVLAAVGAFAQSLVINTPVNAVLLSFCSPLNGVTSVLPGAKPTGTPLENLGTFTGDSFTWNVDIAASTSVGLTLKDSTGAIAQSAPFTIQSSTDTSCLKY